MEVQFRLVPSRNLLTSSALMVFTSVGALVNLNVVIERPLANNFQLLYLLECKSCAAGYRTNIKTNFLHTSPGGGSVDGLRVS